MSPPRVLYSFPHTLGAPGIGTTALNQVLGLLELGVDVTVCCASLGGQASSLAGAPNARKRASNRSGTGTAKAAGPPMSARVIETLAVAGRRIPHRALGIDRALRFHDRRVASLLRRQPRRYDIVHGWPLGSLSTFEVARSAGIAAVRESPNCYTAVAYERVAQEALLLGLEVPAGASHHYDAARLGREENEYDLATAILAPSDAVAESYACRPGRPLEVVRHRYGFDPDIFPAPARTHREDSPFTLLFVGSCEPRKGLHYALQAWRSLDLGTKGSRFVIVGRWEDDYRRLLAEELVGRGVEVREPSSDVGAIMREADALVLPSIEEGSALVTYEAQASGCALLVSNESGALMTNGVHGFGHTARDAAALTDQMELLARDSGLLARMRSAVIEHRDELTWGTAAIRLAECYDSVSARR